jgi:hypothetical protein
MNYQGVHVKNASKLLFANTGTNYPWKNLMLFFMLIGSSVKIILNCGMRAEVRQFGMQGYWKQALKIFL